jgi:uncharacterized protein YecE (DUF72 family)
MGHFRRYEIVIRVGLAGWDYSDWEGIVYPSPPPRGFDRLRYVTDYFDIVELNVTHYRQPARRTAESWARRVEAREDFRFTAKLHRSMTHSPEDDTGGSGRSAPEPGATGWRAVSDADLRAAAEVYRQGIDPLVSSRRLLGVLLQFPQSFDNRSSHRDHMEALATLLAGLPLVAEFRHESWDRSETQLLLRRLGIGFCNIDQPDLRSTLRPTAHVTSSLAYVRLHGRNAANWFRHGRSPFERYDYLYDMDELEPWIERVESLSRSAEQVVVIANNHYRGKAPVTGLMMKAALARRRVKAPGCLVDAYPQLERRVVADRPVPMQRRLF